MWGNIAKEAPESLLARPKGTSSGGHALTGPDE